MVITLKDIVVVLVTRLSLISKTWNFIKLITHFLIILILKIQESIFTF